MASQALPFQCQCSARDSAVGEDVGCRLHSGSGFLMRDPRLGQPTNQGLYPSGIEELGPDLTAKDKTLKRKSHSIDKIRIQKISTISRRSD